MSISYSVEHGQRGLYRGLVWDTDEETGLRLCVGYGEAYCPALAIQYAKEDHRWREEVLPTIPNPYA